MGAMVGFVLGYILGVKAGADGEKQLRDAWQTITSSEEVKDLLSGGLSMAGDLIRQGRGLLVDRLTPPETGGRLSRVA